MTEEKVSLAKCFYLTTSYPLLNEFIKAVESKQLSDTYLESSRVRKKCKEINKTSPEATRILELLEKISKDFVSVEAYSSNLYIKQYILEEICEAVIKSQDEEFKKSCFFLLNKLIELDYDEKNFSFKSKVVTNIYETILSRLIHVITDLSIEQSFYVDDESEEEDESLILFQEEALSLLKYILKCIRLKPLFKMGYSYRHIQFLIINFTQSTCIPEILEALTSNLKNFPNNNEEDDPVELNAYNRAYLTSLKSLNLIFKLHINDNKTLEIITKVHENLASYFKEAIKHPLGFINENKWRNLFRKTVSSCIAKILKETEAKYRKLNYQVLFYYIKIMQLYEENLTKFQKQLITDKLLLSLKRILNAIENSKSFRKLDQDELNIKEECFVLINKLIACFKEEFICTKVKYFEHIWLREVKSKNKAACQALCTMFKIKSKKSADLAHRIIDFLLNDIKTEKNLSCLLVYSEPVISLFRYWSINFPLDDYHPSLVILVEKMKNVLRKLTYRLNSGFAEFCKQILLLYLKKKLYSQNDWDQFVLEIILNFEDVIQSNLDYQLEPKNLITYLELIRILMRTFGRESFMKNYSLSIYEMLIFIESNLESNSNTYWKNKTDVKQICKQMKRLNLINME